jgi:hypothetical protein
LDERALLVEAVVRQWRHYQGQACLFVGDDTQLVLVRNMDRLDLGFRVAGTQVPFPITSALVDLGFAPEAVPQVVRRLNFGAEVKYDDDRGEPWILWYDVLDRRLRCRPRQPLPSSAGHGETDAPPRQPTFPLGDIEVSPWAASVLAAAGQTIAPYLRRHAAGDRGDVGERGPGESLDPILRDTLRSVYYTARGAKLLINTLPDCTRTVVCYSDPRAAAALVRAAQSHRGS